MDARSVHERFPELSERTANTLTRWFRGLYKRDSNWNRGGGMPALLAATDAELLEARNFGVKALREWRAVWPEPRADASTGDPWVEHAAMIALAG